MKPHNDPDLEALRIAITIYLHLKQANVSWFSKHCQVHPDTVRKVFYGESITKSSQRKLIQGLQSMPLSDKQRLKASSLFEDHILSYELLQKVDSIGFANRIIKQNASKCKHRSIERKQPVLVIAIVSSILFLISLIILISVIDV